MSEKPNPTTDTMVMKPRRVFKCDYDQRVMTRKDVWKDAMGKYHCTSCGCLVRDITNTETGNNLMEIVYI